MNMNLLFLKFCYAVEIGAYLAYKGHYAKSKDPYIKTIMGNELSHMINVKTILASYSSKPLWIFNLFFLLLGHTIRLLCKVSPVSLLDYVAQVMEVFNVVNYKYLANKFPSYSCLLLRMSTNEKYHNVYFELKKPEIGELIQYTNANWTTRYIAQHNRNMETM